MGVGGIGAGVLGGGCGGGCGFLHESFPVNCDFDGARDTNPSEASELGDQTMSEHPGKNI